MDDDWRSTLRGAVYRAGARVLAWMLPDLKGRYTHDERRTFCVPDGRTCAELAPLRPDLARAAQDMATDLNATRDAGVVVVHAHHWLEPDDLPASDTRRVRARHMTTCIARSSLVVEYNLPAYEPVQAGVRQVMDASFKPYETALREHVQLRGWSDTYEFAHPDAP